MDYPYLLQLEEEIKILLDYRLAHYQYTQIIVEIYYAMDMAVMCRIELFGLHPVVAHRLAKYEAELKEGFYYEAEQKLIGRLKPKQIKQAS